MLRWPCAAAGLLAAAGAALAGDPLGVLPEAASAEADRIDHLIYLIIWVTGITFVGVQVCLVWFLWKYRRREGVKAKHTHGNHTVEMVWTVAPAAILVFLAVYQMGLWAEVKAQAPKENERPVAVQIYAKQFEWNFRYPGADGKFGTADDLASTKFLVVPVNRPVNAEMRAMDVIHSFFLPNLRFKQDAVPGLHTKIWFRPNKLSADRKPFPDSHGKPVKLEYFDIVCAELCGSQHTTMNGRLYVVTDAQYEAYLRGEDVKLPSGALLPKPDKTSELQSPYDFIWASWSFQDDPVVKAPPKWHRRPFGTDYTGDEEE
jgi:cytochrome c oxidase subunit 2